MVLENHIYSVPFLLYEELTISEISGFDISSISLSNSLTYVVILSLFVLMY